MRNRTRIFALVLVLLMLPALSACGEKAPDLTGSWTAEVELAPMLTEEIDSTLGQSPMGVTIDSFGNYLDSLPCRIRMELKADGTYFQAVDESSLDAMRDSLFDSTVRFYRDLFRRVLITSLQSYGVVGDSISDAELEELMGMSLDEAIELSIGSDMETYVQSILDDMWADLADSIQAEGKYKVEAGKLFLSDSLAHEVDPNIYHPFTLAGGVLTLEKPVGGIDEADDFYPLTFRAEKA